MTKRSAGAENNVSETQRKSQIPNMIVLGLSELVGTGLLMFLGCMGCIETITPMALPHHVPSLSFGLVIMIIIQLFGHVSGGHLNPAVTLSAVLQGCLKPVLLPIYIFGQFAGGFLGFGLLKLLVPHEYTATEIYNLETNTTEHRLGLCTTTLHPKVSAIQGLALEVILTIVLILVCCAVWDKRNVHNTDSVSLRFGLTITCIAMVAGPWTGSSMNTVRSFVPAVYNNDWEAHWIYWFGPTIGSVVGTFFYKTAFDTPKEDDFTDIDGNMEDVPLNEKNLEKLNNV